MMKCEEFELLGLDMDRADALPAEAAAAAQHAAGCPRCSALLESWWELKQDLRILHESTRLESTPARVEMRLKQELRTRREARLPQRTTRVAAWVLAAAATLAAAIVLSFFVPRPKPIPNVPADIRATEVSPEAVMERLNRHLARTVPEAMEPAMSLISVEQPGNGPGGVQ